MKHVLLFALCALILAACERRSATEVAMQTTELCGTDIPFEQLIAETVAITTVEEKPAAGKGASNVIFKGFPKQFTTSVEFTVRVENGRAVDFDGLVDSLAGRLTLPISGSNKDALCAGEFSELVGRAILPEITELLTQAAILKLGELEFFAAEGAFPHSMEEIDERIPYSTVSDEMKLPKSVFSIGDEGKILINLPRYFNSTEAPLISLTPVPNGSRFDWNCSSNLSETEVAAIPHICR